MIFSGHSLEQIDGNDPVNMATNNLSSGFDDKNAAKPKSLNRPAFKRYSVRSKVGYMEFNPAKVNQDRPMEVPKVGREDRSLFGVFDGHGVNGHHVSEFLVDKMSKLFLEHPDLDEDTVESVTQIFAKTSDSLQKSSVDCTFSGSTGVVAFISNRRIYCANVGDSRCVLGYMDGKKLRAKPLSDDHKPDRPDEMARIISNQGRVEACRGPTGPIGPARVWLLNDDVPGLAMARSFGDLIAASVGVICVPEISVHVIGPNDKMIVMGSDGIWEFISNQEAIDMVAESRDCKEACDRLCEEATKRWRREEDVIDDITCIVIELSGDEVVNIASNVSSTPPAVSNLTNSLGSKRDSLKSTPSISSAIRK